MMSSAATRKYTVVRQNYLKGSKHTFGGRGVYAKYNKINNNLENFKGGGKIAAKRGLRSP